MSADEENMYKGSSFYSLRESDAQSQARKRDQAEAEKYMPQIEQALDILRTNIGAYNTLPAIPDEILELSDKEAVAFRNQVAVNKQTVANLIPILNELEGIFRQYKR